VNKNCGGRFKLLIIIAVLLASSCRGQEISTGFRLGYGGGLSLLWQPGESISIEGIVTPRWGGVIATGLLYKTVSMANPKWKWYYGAGIHVGYHHRDNFVGEGFSGADPYINQGFDLIVGIRYEFPEMPINVSLDFKPSVELTTERNMILETFGLTVRYFIRRE